MSLPSIATAAPARTRDAASIVTTVALVTTRETVRTPWAETTAAPPTSAHSRSSGRVIAAILPSRAGGPAAVFDRLREGRPRPSAGGEPRAGASRACTGAPGDRMIG